MYVNSQYKVFCIIILLFISWKIFFRTNERMEGGGTSDVGRKEERAFPSHPPFGFSDGVREREFASVYVYVCMSSRYVVFRLLWN